MPASKQNVCRAEWVPWRSREVLWVKPKTDRNGQTYYYTKDGRTIPEEALKHNYERIDDKEKPCP